MPATQKGTWIEPSVLDFCSAHPSPSLAQPSAPQVLPSVGESFLSSSSSLLYVKVPGLCSTLRLIQLPGSVHCVGQQVQAHVLGFLLLLWETWLEFQTPDLGLVLPGYYRHLGNGSADAELCAPLYIYMLLCCFS